MQQTRRYAEIKVIRTINPLTGDPLVVGYEWEGDVNDPVCLPRSVDLDELPWKLKFVEDANFGRYKIYVRTDYGILRAKIQNLKQLLKFRIILTLIVWGFGEIQLHSYPSWEDIRFIRKLLQK